MQEVMHLSDEATMIIGRSGVIAAWVREVDAMVEADVFLRQDIGSPFDM
jgi:photosystem II stability/assembly factor-like uncharacterized protein